MGWLPYDPVSPQFSYVDAEGRPLGVVQLSFLRLLSTSARQNFTYLCQHSAAWYSHGSPVGGYQHALHFRGANEEDLSYNSSPYVKALTDGCAVSAPRTGPGWTDRQKRTAERWGRDPHPAMEEGRGYQGRRKLFPQVGPRGSHGPFLPS